MKIYNYNPDTDEFISESNAYINPVATQREGKNVYLIPANATDMVPPEKQDGKAIVFKDNVWTYVTDNRGLVVYNFDDYNFYSGSSIIKDLEVEIGVQQTKIAPDSSLMKPMWTGEWVEGKDLQEFKTELITKIKNNISSFLSTTDWMITRSKEQMDAGVPQSISTQDYNKLLAQRQTARDWSNQMELQINATSKINDLKAIKTDYIEDENVVNKNIKNLVPRADILRQIFSSITSVEQKNRINAGLKNHPMFPIFLEDFNYEGARIEISDAFAEGLISSDDMEMILAIVPTESGIEEKSMMSHSFNLIDRLKNLFKRK